MIEKIRLKLSNNILGKNIILIASGTMFAQALSMILSPIITRLYAPEEYGVLTAYSSLVAIITIAASLDYEKAIPLPKEDSDAANLLVIATTILFSVVLILTGIVSLFGENLLVILKNESLFSYKYLIPIGVFFIGLYNILLQWSYRERNYKIITRTRISQSITANFAKLFLGILNIGPIGLVSAAIFGNSAGILSLMTPLNQKRNIFKDINLSSLKKLLIRYRKFPLFSAPSNYVYTAGVNLPVIFLTTLFGTTVTGHYGLAYSITHLPLSLIGNSVGQVFYAEVAKIGKTDPKRTKNLAIKLIKKIALYSFLPFLILIIISPYLFPIAFGDTWVEAGRYASILFIMSYFHFMITPIGRILEIFDYQQRGLALNVVRLFLILSVFILAGSANLSVYQTLILYSVVNSFTYILLLWIVMRSLNKEIEKNKLKVYKYY